MNEEAIQYVVNIITGYGLSVIAGVAILILGWIAAGWVSRAVGRALARADRVDQTIRGFLVGLVKYALIAFVVIAVLNQFGVQTTSLIAVFGAASLAIGLAMQGTLSNVAAGVMLLLFRPFQVGQYVEVAGTAGTVRNLGLFTTELATPNNVHIVVPNASIWGSTVINYSHHPTRRVDWTLGIAYDDDIGKAMQCVRDVLNNEPRVLADPEAMVAVSELADSSVNLVVRAWVNSADFWGVKFDLTRAFKEAFDANGISIPFPQHDVHLIGGGASVPAS